MSTIADRNALKALYDIVDATSPLRTAIEGIVVNTDNSDIVTALANLSPDNSDVVQAIQNFSYAALITKIDAILALLTGINSKTPIYQSSSYTKTSINPVAATATKLFNVNLNRKAFTIYNNSTNSLYVLLENPAAGIGGSQLIDFCGTNAGPTSVVKWVGPAVPTGEIWVLRNSGTGTVCGWEFV